MRQGSPRPTTRARRGRVGIADGVPTQRDRLVAAMGELTAEVGSAATGVHHVCQRAGISRRTFYDLYADRDACFVDAHQEAFGRLVGHVAEAVADAGPEWEDRAVATTQALLGAWDADRVLAHLCLVSSVGGQRRDDGAAPRGDRPDRGPAGRRARAAAAARSRCSPAPSAACGSWRCAA